MSDSYIHLAIAALQLTIIEFWEPEAFLRSPAAPGQGSALSVWGNPIRYGYGRLRDPQQLWSFTGVLSVADSRTLTNIYLHQKDLLDRKQLNYGIILTDTISEFREFGGTRTRAKAPAPFDTETISGNLVCYYARYAVEFVQEPVRLETWDHAVLGKAELIQCALQELGQKVAP